MDKELQDTIDGFAACLKRGSEIFGSPTHGTKYFLALHADNARLREAVGWALQRGTWAHVDHPPSDKEWEYYVTELRRRAQDAQ